MSQPLTKIQVAAVEQLAAEGFTIRQVANKIGATYFQVNYLRKKLEIKFTLGIRPTPEANDDQIRKRWVKILPELKFNLLQDIAKIIPSRNSQ